MKLTSLLLSAVLCWAKAQGLWCWNCINAKSNAECLEKGSVEICKENENACHNEIRRGSYGLSMTKRCKQDHACKNNEVQNQRAAWSPSQCNSKVPSSVCRCCCEINGCNVEDSCIKSVRCPPVSSPKYGKKRCRFSQSLNEIGTVCDFECNKDYEMVGPGNTKCVEMSNASVEFNNPVPRCIPKALPCPLVEVPQYATMKCTDGRTFGSICSFTCSRPGVDLKSEVPKGIVRIGAEAITCGPNSQWDEIPPTCEIITCPSITPDDTVSMYCTDGNHIGSVCSFACDQDSERVGSSSVTCLLFGEIGNWSEPASICKRIRCNDSPAPPSDGRIRCTDGNYLHSECRFECNEFHRLIGSPTTRCGISQEGNFVWNNNTPTCELEECLPVMATEHSKMTCTNGRTVGSICSFICNDFFEIVSEDPDILPIRVESKHRLVGERTITCQPFNREWTSIPPTCVAVNCSSVDAPVGGTVSCNYGSLEGSICRFSCDADRELIGSSSITCQHIGVVEAAWSNPIPVCERAQCNGHPVRPANGEVICTDNAFLHSECLFSCNELYRLNGSQTTVCIRGENAKPTWSNSNPQCEVKSCQPATVPEHGGMTCTNGSLVNSVCSFFCENVFETYPNGPENPPVLVPSVHTLLGEQTITCQLNEQWSSVPPVCVGIDCEQLTPPETVLMSCTYGAREGSECRFSCPSDRRLVGPTSTVCQHVELERATWSNRLPVCQRITCEKHQLKNGKTLCSDGNFANSQCFYQCDSSNFTLTPASVTLATCQLDGSWSNPQPCCYRNCPTQSLVDLVVLVDSSSSIGKENWKIIKAFVRDAIASFTLGPDAARIGVFRFNRFVDTKTQILLKDYPNSMPRLLQAYDKIPYSGRGTKTGQALRHARNVLLAPGNGNRPEAPDYIFVITDGRSQDTIQEVARQLEKDGIHVIAVGVQPPRGRLDYGQLRSLVTHEEDLIIAQSGFAGLDAINVFSNQIEIFCIEGCS